MKTTRRPLGSVCTSVGNGNALVVAAAGFATAGVASARTAATSTARMGSPFENTVGWSEWKAGVDHARGGVNRFLVGEIAQCVERLDDAKDAHLILERHEDD